MSLFKLTFVGLHNIIYIFNNSFHSLYDTYSNIKVIRRKKIIARILINLYLHSFNTSVLLKVLAIT